MEVINNIPSSNSKYSLLFLVIATLGMVLTIASYWIHYHIIGAVALLCEIYAIYFIVDSLRKGIKNLSKITKGLLVITEVLIISKLAITVAIWVTNLMGTSLYHQQFVREHAWIIACTDLVIRLYCMPLFIAFIILCRKYKGAVRNISLIYIIIPIGSLLFISCRVLIAIVTGSEQIVSSIKSVVAIILSIAMYALYLIAYKAIACKYKTPDNQANQTI